MTDVLCCCNPENVMGTISKEDGLRAGLELRETVDEDGNPGFAFAYDSSVELEAAGTKRGPRRTWRHGK